MKAIVVVVQLLLICTMEYGIHGVSTRTTADRIQSFGYSSETHTVVTPDGYVLSLFRLANSTPSEPRPSRPAVLMMHGLSSSSDSWVISGPPNALVLNMVDSGYDVWLGNSRGTPYGSRHLNMTSSDRSFWRFSWHEIGVIDLPATIDYILKETGQPSLHYVGHSQGTTIMFVLLSTQPDYNQKLKTSHMLAPIVYMKYARSLGLKFLDALLGNYKPLDRLFGGTRFLQLPLLRKVIARCSGRQFNLDVCSLAISAVTGGYSAYLDKSLVPEIFSFFPASASTHQAIHLAQLHASGYFRQYDHGVVGNLQRYNLPSPPDYRLSNINPRFPMHLYYSDYDELSSKTDVEHLSHVLGNRTVRHFIELRQFTHTDFQWAANVKDVLNRGVLEIMDDAELLMQSADSV